MPKRPAGETGPQPATAGASSSAVLGVRSNSETGETNSSAAPPATSGVEFGGPALGGPSSDSTVPGESPR
ncbi:MAG: hypothetical protein QM775_10690 [Pirellulales bacterium]